MLKRDLTYFDFDRIKIEDKNKKLNGNKILCIHCKRTKNNNLSCIGKCIADNEY